MKDIITIYNKKILKRFIFIYKNLIDREHNICIHYNSIIVIGVSLETFKYHFEHLQSIDLVVKQNCDPII